MSHALLSAVVTSVTHLQGHFMPFYKGEITPFISCLRAHLIESFGYTSENEHVGTYKSTKNWKMEHHLNLVGGWTTHLKNISQNGFIFPNFRGENKKIFETTTQEPSHFLFFWGYGCEFCSPKFSSADWGFPRPTLRLRPRERQPERGGWNGR